MPRITICPRCTSHLGLPAEVSPAAQVQCPICEVEFSLATVVPRELPQARVLEHVEADDAAGAARELSPQERLSQLIRSTAGPTPAPDEADPTESYDDAYQDADPELSTSKPPAQAERPLGSSRLDQLLSDLTSAPTPPVTTPAPPSASVPESFAEPTAAETDSPLGSDFEADLDDELYPRPTAEAAEIADRQEDDVVHDADEAEEEEPVAFPALGGGPSGEQPPSELRTAPRRKRRSSGLRTLVGVIGGGMLGILFGLFVAYGLLWLRGADGDFVGLARYLPPSMLPESVAQVASDDSASVDPGSQLPPVESAGQASSLAVAERPPMEFDPAVAPATAEEPIDDEDALGEVLAEAPVTPPVVADSPDEQQTSHATPIVAELRGVKLYSVDELAELIPAAADAQSEFLAGDLASEESWSSMGPAYMTLASLAERYTLVKPSDRSGELAAKQAAAEDIFRTLVGEPARRADLTTVAARWLQHERRLNQGVVLVGRVTDVSPQGKWTQYAVDVPLGDSFVTAHVLMDRAQSSFSAGQDVAVVGAILPRPVEQLAGYEGDAAQVVIAGYAFMPEESASPQSGAATGQSPLEISAAGQ